jgi:putative flippase GtrA
MRHTSELVWIPAGAGGALPAAIMGLSPYPRFLLLGGLCAGVNVLARYLLTPAIGFGAAVPVAYLIGMALAYCLFRWFVFGSSGRGVGSEVKRFVVVNLVALMLVFVVSINLARVVFPAIGFTWMADDIAHVIGVLTPALSSWIGHDRYTFRSQTVRTPRPGCSRATQYQPTSRAPRIRASTRGSYRSSPSILHRIGTGWHPPE